MARITGDASNNALMGDTDLGNIDDQIYGYGGDDTLSGLLGNDTLSGGYGGDLLAGSDGAHALNGDDANNNNCFDGADILDGGNGNDNLFGGGDTFIVEDVPFSAPASCSDTIADFSAAQRGGAAVIPAITRVQLGAGNLNGDGFDDIIIGARTAFFTDAGASYLVFGTASGFAATFSLSSVNRTNGFRLGGASSYDLSGNSVASAGDVNGDGFDDLIIGAYNANPDAFISGAACVVFGASSGFAASLDLSTLYSTNGFALGGAAMADSLGRSVAAAGDINGDGLDDLVIGAWNADPNGDNSGATYVVFGQRAQAAVIILGTAQGLTHNSGLGDDTIDGRDGNDTLKGWEGDDTLLGGGGNDGVDGGSGDDVIDGGSGNDTINGGDGNDAIRGGSGSDTVVGSLGEDDIDGGSGMDMLSFSAFAANRPVEVNLATRLVLLHDGDEQLLLSIENATGSQGADTLTGNGRANVLIGGSGNDVINGGNGNDTASGGAGNDTLIAGTGADIFDGGADVDTASYAASTSAVIAALNGSFANAGDALGDSFVSVENLIGSAFNDTLRGTNGVNIINAGAGNDRIEGLTGIDTLTGGAGNDTFFFNQPADGADIITDFGSTPTTNDDRFEIRGANFGGLPVGALAANQFQSSTSNVAGTATVRFFHETDTGKLFWDRDGSAGAFGPVLLATLQAGAVVTVGDFTII